MADAQQLTHTFLAEHSSEAAHVIETLPAQDAGALFEVIPARLAAPVAAAMLPAAAARVLGRTHDEAALALLTATGAQAAVAILRHIADPRRSQLIAALPALTAVASRILLGFPEDAVGAWADPEVIAVGPGDPVSAALARIRESHAPGIDQVYVVDTQRRLLGRVSLATLVRVAESTRLATLLQSPPEVIAAMMPIAAAANLPAWANAVALPVIDREARLVGTLRHSALTRALRDRTRVRPRAEQSATGVLAAGYWGIVSGLAAAALALLPPVARILPVPAGDDTDPLADVMPGKTRTAPSAAHPPGTNP